MPEPRQSDGPARGGLPVLDRERLEGVADPFDLLGGGPPRL
jgi:hypothetical protein